MTRARDLAKLIAGSSTLGGTGELVLKDVDTADGSSPKITFQTGDTDIAADDVLGTIDFQAPDEGTGTDALLVAAGIEAVSEGDFSASSNATKLSFKTGASETATEKMTIASDGNVGIGVEASTSYGNALQIHDTGTSGANLRLTDSTSGSSTGNGFEIVQIGVNNYALNRENGFIATYTNNTERMRIAADGDIGIGVNDPDATLDISGGTNKLGILRIVQRVSGAAAYGLDMGLDGSTGDPVFSRIVNDTVTESFRIVRSNGEVDIGQHSHTADFMLQVASSNLSGTRGGISVQNKTDNTGGYFLAFYRSNNALIGSISQGSGSVAYNTTSDYRLKENVNYSFDATTRLKQLKPCIFNWIDDEDNTPIDGFLAHEVSSVVPEAITGEKDATEEIGIIKDSNGNTIREKASKPSDLDEGDTWTATGTQPVYQGIDQSKLVPLLVKTIQELEARITALEAE